MAFSFNVSTLRDLHDNGMNTSYCILSSDMKLVEEVNNESCFARCSDFFNPACGYLPKKGQRYIKYFPYTRCQDDASLGPVVREMAEKFIEVALTIPFIKERVVEFTGFNNSPRGRSKYVLVDVHGANVGEAFTTLQVFRLAQEKVGNLVTFARVLEETGDEMLAFLLALNFSNCKGTPRLDGHIPSNNLDYMWGKEFLKDPSIARDHNNKWKSEVFYPSGDSVSGGLTFEQYKQFLCGDNPPVHTVAVYGTLREGNGNHVLLSSAMTAGKAVYVSRYRVGVAAKLYDTCCGFPALVPDAGSDKVVTFEVYRVDDDTFSRLDSLEGYPRLYDRVRVNVNGHVCWVYVQPSADGYKEIERGDWNEYLTPRRRQGALA